MTRKSKRKEGLPPQDDPAAPIGTTVARANSPEGSISSDPSVAEPKVNAAYRHVTETLLNRPPATQIAFHAVMEQNGLMDSILDIALVPTELIREMEYSSNGVTKQILVVDAAKLNLWKAFVEHKTVAGSPLVYDDDILDITKEEFDAFRVGYIAKTSSTATPAASTPSFSDRNRRSKADTFSRAIKRDASEYIVIKEDSQFNNWKLHTTSKARTHNCREVLDPSYVPVTPEDKEIFEMQQEFMYSVFLTTLQTSFGRKLTREHQFDAQTIYSRFINHYTESVKANMTQTTLMQYLTTTRLGENGTWKGSYHSFILHFLQQYKNLDDVTPAGAHMSDELRMVFLQNAVSPIPALHAIQTTAEQLNSSTGKTQTLDQYVDLLTTTTQRLDSTASKSKTRTQRSAFVHDITPSDDAYFDEQQDWTIPDDGEEYDIDSSVTTILANASQRLPKQPTGFMGNPAARLSDEVFKALSNEGKQHWRKIPVADKLAILGKSSSSAPPGTSAVTPFRKVNLHEISAADYLAITASQDDSSKESDAPQKKVDVNETQLIEYKPAGKAIAPKKYAISAAELRANVSASDPRSILKKETKDNSHQVIINGEPYVPKKYSMNLHYRVSLHEQTDGTQPLMDRGSNGGVAGSDVRKLYSHPHKRVTIEGIDRHQIKDVPLGTFGGVVSTSAGLAILVLPFYAEMGRGPTILCPAQMEYYGHKVDDKSRLVKGTQCITTPNGLVIPMNVVNGLPRLPMRPFTDEERDTLPHIFMADDSKPWDPSVLDNTLTDETSWLDSFPEPKNNNPSFDITGNYNKRTNLHVSWSFDPWGEGTENGPSTSDEDVIVFDNEPTARPAESMDKEPIALLEETIPTYAFSTDISPQWETNQYTVDPMDTLLDGIVDLCDDIKQHNHLVELLLSQGNFTSEHNGLSPYSCDDVSNSRMLVHIVQTRSQREKFPEHNPADIPTEDVPSDGPPPEPPPVQPVAIELDDIEDDLMDPIRVAGRPSKVSPSKRDWDSLRPLFGWLGTDVIKQTFDCTTQLARSTQSERLFTHFRSPHPALNVHRRNESLATDTVYSDEKAIWGGFSIAQFFVGLTSQVCDVYPLKSEKQFVNTLEDIIRERGAPTRLVSDSAQVEISERVKDILRTLVISGWQSEPHQHHQNPAERKYQQVIHMTNLIMDRTGAPAGLWFECMKYVCYLLNHTYNQSIAGVPLEKLTGQQVDISALLRFHWYQPVYYQADRDNETFPSESKEARGHIVGIAEHVGHELTYRILTDDTIQIVPRSNVRAVDPKSSNKRVDLLSGEDIAPPSKFVKSMSYDIPDGETNGEQNGETKQPNMPVFSPTDLVGRTFLMQPDQDGNVHRARITEAIQDMDNDTASNPTRIKFKCSINNDQFEELIAYNEVVDYISRDNQQDTLWQFEEILSHQGPLSTEHPDYNGSTYNVQIKWSTGEVTTEPLSVIAADNPVTCALYAKEHNLLDKPGWKRFKKIANRHKKTIRMVNQAKLRSYNSAPKYMFGYLVPKTYKQALELDAQNGNTKWQDCTILEMNQLSDYSTFRDLGHKDSTRIPAGHKKIKVHLVYAVKHDGRHKARLVADGHLTDVPLESVYSGVVSLRGIRLVAFIAELNNLQLWSTDIGNAYLEATTKERLVIIAGPEFAELEGHVLVIQKALYGLRTSGLRWHERFAKVLKELGFEPCKAEPDIWMRPSKDGRCYEYVAVYVDDLMFAMDDPAAFEKELVMKYNFKLKGTGEIEYHIGMDFFRDADGVLCTKPKKYIAKMMDTYERMFGTTPSTKFSSPLESGDHPELDQSELLDAEGVQKYQSLIGTLQWIISIGRFDIQTAVMTLSSFRAAPRRGHLERAKRIFGYIKKFENATIRFRTDIPDLSAIPELGKDWSSTIYGEAKEIVPKDAPIPLGRPVVTITYVDANLMHDILSGKSVTGILHLLNKTPIDWYSKKQATVETATYGSEFVAARTATEQIVDLRLTLRYLGIPICDHSFLFGDNASVVGSSTLPDAKITKRHVMLSFHRVRQAVASGMLRFHHIVGKINPADILSKHWANADVWSIMKALLHWQGDTSQLFDDK